MKLKILIILLLFIPSLSWAAITLPWSTSFTGTGCTAEWIQWDALTCDGLETAGGWIACPGGVVTGGNVEGTNLIDTMVNFVTGGIVVGDSVWNETLNQEAEITSIATTTNPNDTLNFVAMAAPNVSGNTYTIYNHWEGAIRDHTTLAKKEQITTAANNPSGVGGRGQRHWNRDGSNANSGGLAITFNSAQTEIWMRWYMRYQAGFAWSYLNYNKWVYMITAGTTACIPIFFGDVSMRLAAQGGSNSPESIGWGWPDIMSGATSDGNFHYYEFHAKMDTTSTPDWDGIGELWVDGVLRAGLTNVNWSNGNATDRLGWTSLTIGSNQATPDNGLIPYYVDFDDIAINNTGYIGPLSGSGLTLGSGGSMSLGSGGSITF